MTTITAIKIVYYRLLVIHSRENYGSLSRPDDSDDDEEKNVFATLTADGNEERSRKIRETV
jgi:hypothetical protein